MAAKDPIKLKFRVSSREDASRKWSEKWGVSLAPNEEFHVTDQLLKLPFSEKKPETICIFTIPAGEIRFRMMDGDRKALVNGTETKEAVVGQGDRIELAGMVTIEIVMGPVKRLSAADRDGPALSPGANAPASASSEDVPPLEGTDELADVPALQEDGPTLTLSPIEMSALAGRNERKAKRALRPLSTAFKDYKVELENARLRDEGKVIRATDLGPAEPLPDEFSPSRKPAPAKAAPAKPMGEPSEALSAFAESTPEPQLQAAPQPLAEPVAESVAAPSVRSEPSPIPEAAPVAQIAAVTQAPAPEIEARRVEQDEEISEILEAGPEFGKADAGAAVPLHTQKKAVTRKKSGRSRIKAAFIALTLAGLAAVAWILGRPFLQPYLGQVPFLASLMGSSSQVPEVRIPPATISLRIEPLDPGVSIQDLQSKVDEVKRRQESLKP